MATSVGPLPLAVLYGRCMDFLTVKERWQSVALVSHAWRVVAMASVKAHKHVDFTWCRGEDQLEHAVATLLSDVSHNAFAAELLSEHVNRVQLQSVVLYGPRVTPHLLSRLLQGVTPHQLERISIESKWLDAAGFSILAQCHSLLQLRLNCIKLSDAELVLIATGCPNLELVDIAGCSRIGDDGIAALARHCRSLQELDVSMCIRVTDAGFVALAHRPPTLRRLAANKCLKITEASLALVVHAQTQLQSLSVGNCPKVRDLFLATLRPETPLTSLVLSGCASISDAPLIPTAPRGCLSSFFQSHGARLQTLDLTGLGQLTSETLQRISLCPTLTHLTLAMCRNVTDADVAVIAEGCPQLQGLSLHGCVLVTDTALVSIATHCKHLRDASFVFCYNVTDVGFVALVKRCVYLTHLNVKACNLLTELSFAALAQRVGAAFRKLVIGACASLATTATYAALVKQGHPDCIVMWT
ncbi:hypothetical protein SDRG_15207 [Saprolegnia diclina VS20]|uniref:F-box/LRR-repeat protein 15-like leucin rich repeat domain-containing protein n=1 Tax=Saprolegnia diclina (strain VS20) TaxID=1156394 RepID=T0PNM2_SAPDV|nr:hypothetical protein SDRG_15207 [Saprolegnia diclina VS20]EQC26994.1 hypothetical protein SDRG_15207 [Saprolegnia diclina VS20]|eukprot:XP_008619596.1 hypothetical protein SDRG_15207 [Saprolegnia diclina VS20]